MSFPLAKRSRGPFLLGPRVNGQSCRGKTFPELFFLPWFQGLAPQVPDTAVRWSVWFSFLLQESAGERPFWTGPDPIFGIP